MASLLYSQDQDYMTKLQLDIYYKRLFPFEEYYRWLSYGDQSRFEHREFAFDVMKRGKNIFIRHKSFNNYKLLELEARRLIPIKIHIGAVYNIRPTKDHSDSRILKYFATERELIFDIDLNDYDDVRTCCTGDRICHNCWKFIAIGCKILEHALTVNFGYKNMLWAFSGRRGVHCWVCDKEARLLKRSNRKAVTGYIQLGSARRIDLSKRMTTLARFALDLVNPIFETFILKEQEVLRTDERLDRLLNVIDEDEHKKTLKSQMKVLKTSKERWDVFVSYVKNLLEDPENKYSKYIRLIEETILHFTYLRMDTSVTESERHLIKAPFSVHPSTGRISIPFSVAKVDEFSVSHVPAIDQIYSELVELAPGTAVLKNDINAKRKDYKTSLSGALTVFREFISNLDNNN